MKRFRLFWILILVSAIAVVYLPGLSKYLRLKRKETDLDREIKRLEEQIVQLRNEEHLLKTDLTRLEEVVREELGLVKPGEVVLKVVEEKTSEPIVPSEDKSVS